LDVFFANTKIRIDNKLSQLFNYIIMK